MDSWPSKDPQDYADYYFNWEARIASLETIVSSTFTLTGSVSAEMDNEAIIGNQTRVWIRGGELGEVIEVTNSIVTSIGREWDKTARLRIRSS